MVYIMLFKVIVGTSVGKITAFICATVFTGIDI